MKVKVFYPNREGKIEFTRQELEKLLDEVYREGQKDCNCSKSLTWTTPYYNGSLAGNSTTNATITTNSSAINDFKADTTVNNKEVKPYSLTMKISETDVNKAAEAIKAMLDQTGTLTPQRVEDVFSGLAKELNF